MIVLLGAGRRPGRRRCPCWRACFGLGACSGRSEWGSRGVPRPRSGFATALPARYTFAPARRAGGGTTTMRTMRIRGAAAILIALGALAGAAISRTFRKGSAATRLSSRRRTRTARETLRRRRGARDGLPPAGRQKPVPVRLPRRRLGRRPPAHVPHYTCGVSGACRAPTGAFKGRGDTITEDIVSIELADLDGDKRSDVVTIGGQEIRVRYYDEVGHFESKTPPSRRPAARSRWGSSPRAPRSPISRLTSGRASA